ncbi:hypothetical protein D3Z51_16860 [Clostridiaceae bacterium]|nr:hypothetical protein [Clostridiaceae bacterium]RKI10205.1 hypothetical protein D7V81_16320 [bacterium 1XD21-70]
MSANFLLTIIRFRIKIYTRDSKAGIAEGIRFWFHAGVRQEARLKRTLGQEVFKGAGRSQKPRVYGRKERE